MLILQVRKELEEAGARVASGAEPPDEKPLAVKKEEPDPEVPRHYPDFFP